MSRSLACRSLGETGVLYRAEEAAGAFLGNLASPYMKELQARAEWVAETFDTFDAAELDALIKEFFSAWTTEFQPVDLGTQEELF